MSDVVIVAIIAALPGVLAAILGRQNRNKLEQVSGQIDGRLTELLELTRKSSHAAGMLDEKENGRRD
jgi:hypothetical protein